MACILIGKVIYGFCAQVLVIAGPKMLDETVPAHMLGDFGFLTNLYITIGQFLAYLIGLGLPTEPGENEINFAQNEFWRVCYGFPILFCIAQLMFCFCGVLRHDSILFLLQRGKDDEAL